MGIVIAGLAWRAAGRLAAGRFSSRNNAQAAMSGKAPAQPPSGARRILFYAGMLGSESGDAQLAPGPVLVQNGTVERGARRHGAPGGPGKMR